MYLSRFVFVTERNDLDSRELQKKQLLRNTGTSKNTKNQLPVTDINIK